jgi:hypothetical protein
VNIDQLIASVRAAMAPKLEARNAHKSELETIRGACAAESREPNETESPRITAARAAIATIDAELETQRARIVELEEEKRRDEAADSLAREVHPTGAGVPAIPGESRAYDQVARIGQEKRTFSPGSDPKGVRFLSEVAATALTGRWSDDLVQHMTEERVERGAKLEALTSRAAGTSAFSGLVVPQYLTELAAPHAKGGRPFADACRHHDLPETGMTVNISKITTGTSTDIQTEGSGVSETDIDDTLLSPAVQTNAGQQTLSRQAVERGVGVDDTTIDDLFRSYSTKLDSTLLNQATNGLTNVATAIAYTDGTPTAAELYPKLLAGPAAVEAALLDMDQGDTIAVMHSRRWYWLQSQLTSTWPMFGQPSAAAQQAGVNYGERYGSGFRGILPSGVAAIVDNNIATNLGASTNEDEIYFGAQSELHLWEDSAAPMLIRAEQPKAANLQVLLVVYGYFAYTFARRAHAQKVGGTGLVTPTF